MKKTERLLIPQYRTHHIKTLAAESLTPKYKHTVLNTKNTKLKTNNEKIERLFIQKYRTHHIKALPVEAATPNINTVNTPIIKHAFTLYDETQVKHKGCYP